MIPITQTLPLLRELLGNSVRIAQVALLKEGQDYAVWAVDTRSPALSLIVKLGGPEAEYTCAFERTAAVLKLVRAQTQLPVPEVLAADESLSQWPWRFFIKTYLPGQEWAEVAEQVPAYALDSARAELGRHIASLHQIRFAGFGSISNTGTVSAPRSCYAALADHARQIIRDPRAQEFFLQALEARRALFEPVQTPSLCHEDLHKHNILLHQTNRGWQIATILDFEKAWAGHRETDLARMDLWQMTGAPFWSAYQAAFSVDGDYPARRPLYQLLWCLEFAMQTPEHLETTRAVCQELGIPEITRYQPTFQVTTKSP